MHRADGGRSGVRVFAILARWVALAWVLIPGPSRAQDAVGLALVVNGLSSAARDYFEAGGLGILIGDGALRYGAEKIAETYYALRVTPHWTVTADYQYIDHPAYNRDRGPVSVLGARLHMDY